MFRQALWLAAMLGVVLFAFLSVAGYALAPMGIAPDIRPGTIAFLHGIRWGVPALTLYLAMRYLSDGLHWTLPTMLLGFGGLARAGAARLCADVRRRGLAGDWARADSASRRR